MVEEGAEVSTEEEETTAVVEEARRPEPNRRRAIILGVSARPRIKAPDTLITPHSRGARCTGSGGSRLSSARSRPHVRGRIFTLQNLKTNETVASSAERIVTQRLILCY